jgi:RNA polymerase sigma-70 factor (ECF subfamily)
MDGETGSWPTMMASDELTGESPRRVRRGQPGQAPREAEAGPLDGEADDGTLVRAAVGGSREAFDVLVERHRRAVYRVCYRFTGRHEDASDVAQEVFLRAFRGLPAFKGDAAFSTWLYRIAVNACLNRAAARRHDTEELAPDGHADTTTPPPDAGLLAAERARRVRAAVKRLPRAQRATVILRVYHELPHGEIARILGSSVGAVKANFFHALRNLRRQLEEKG